MAHPELYAQGIMISSSAMIVAAGIIPLLIERVLTREGQIRGHFAIVVASIIIGLFAIAFALTWFSTTEMSYFYTAAILHGLQLLIIGIFLVYLLAVLLRR